MDHIGRCKCRASARCPHSHTINANSDGAWGACMNFMSYLSWREWRLAALGPKLEGLPDDHRSKPDCLLQLSQLFHSVGNRVECKRLPNHALKLQRERGSDYGFAETLLHLSDVNRVMDLPKEGIHLAKEAFGFSNCSVTQRDRRSVWPDSFGRCTQTTSSTSQKKPHSARSLLQEKGSQFLICQFHRVLCVV